MVGVYDIVENTLDFIDTWGMQTTRTGVRVPEDFLWSQCPWAFHNCVQEGQAMFTVNKASSQNKNFLQAPNNTGLSAGQMVS